MALANVNELKSAVVDYTTRSDLPLNVLIALAETKFASVIKHRLSEKYVDIAVAAGSASFPLPVDFKEGRSIKINHQPLTLASIDSLNADPGLTNQYAIVGNTIRLQSRPAKDATVALVYYSRVPALTDANQTNWLLTAFPDVYLYGVLLEYAIWAQDQDKAAAYSQLFATALANLAADHAKGSFSGSTLQTRRFT
ncbi:phage adaptor protein [Methylobacterium sp. NFXW15]|uniref:phage adaptor protein n=1 Tax=Methylobacterium sp. NFXW15 TaxID=2819512 RepID=UPI003CEB0953